MTDAERDFWVAGVDGCRGGWLLVQSRWQVDRCRDVHLSVVPSFREVVALPVRPRTVAVDIPIGLLGEPRKGGRDCDQFARKLLGKRASCVFSPPARSSLGARRYEEVRSRGMSRQAFGILPKIREADRVMTPAIQQRVFEAHPELAFLALSGLPLPDNKKTAAGIRERVRLLRPFFPTVKEALATPFNKIGAGTDDFLDALVLSWVAWKKVTGKAVCLPERPGRDARGLEMAIWY